MIIRYIQAAVSEDDLMLFKRFAFDSGITLSELVGVAVKSYIESQRKEAKGAIGYNKVPDSGRRK